MQGFLHGDWRMCYDWYEPINRIPWRLGVAFLTQAETADIRVREVSVTEDELSVGLMDGRTITVPLAWYPRLADATPAQRAHWEVSGAGYGIHWPDLDEDLSTEGLLRGTPAPHGSATWRSPFAASGTTGTTPD